MTVTIRKAQAQDAEALSRLGIQTFVETFGDLYAREDLDHFLEADHSVAYYRDALQDAARHIEVAVADGDLCGYLICRPMQLPYAAAEDDAAELYRLYVGELAQGRGIGKRFVGHAIEWAAARSAPALYLGVFSENLRAQRLYEGFKFVKVGEYDFPVGKQLDREFIYRLDIA